MIFYGDLETYSEVPINHGTYKYAENCEVMLFAWAVDDCPVQVWDRTAEPEVPGDLAFALEAADLVLFHNSSFDRVVLRESMGMDIPLDKWFDTMACAMAHSLPGALGKLCEILSIPQDQAKEKAGKELVRLFCKPRPKNQKLRRATRETHPLEWAAFVNYAGLDVEAERAIYRKLPKWNYSGPGLALWRLDQRINDRGVAIDQAMAEAAIRAADRIKKQLGDEAVDITGGVLTKTTQRDRLLSYILFEHGVELPDLTGDTIERRIDDPELPWQVKVLLQNRLEASRASTAKYKAMLRAVDRRGRICGMTKFAGALRTARWAGRIVQLQNLMRTPKYLAGDAEVLAAVDAILAECVELLYESPLEVLAAAVPWTLVAERGKKLVAPDLSNIEGRVLAWLAGEAWKLDAFRAQDADPKNKTKDLYIIGYSRSFGEPIAEVVKDYEAGGKKRQVGKVQELALGYQGGVGAFVSMSAVYRVDLNELTAALPSLPSWAVEKAERAWQDAEAKGATYELPREVYMVCHAFTSMWRKANPAIVQFWWDLERAVRDVITGEATRATVGRIEFDRVAAWLRIRLPSGHYLCYPSPRIDPDGSISYMGVNQYTRRWQRVTTYGGKLAENVTQAVATGAGGILGDSMPRAEAAGYPIVFHVHDELVAEVPDTGDYSADALGEILTTNPPWADGLPLAAGGYETYRYRKD